MDADSQERISTYLQVLSNPTEPMQQLCLVHCREAFSTMLSERLAQEAAEAPAAAGATAPPLPPELRQAVALSLGHA